MKKQQHNRHDKTAMPIDIIPVMKGKKPWYQSTTLQGGIILICAIIAGKMGWVFEDGEKAQLEGIIKSVAELVGVIMVFWGRLKADTKLSVSAPKSGLPLLLVLAACVVLSGCVGTFESAVDPETGESPAMLGSATGVIGARTVAGVEFPPVLLPIGIGVGVWIVRAPNPEEPKFTDLNPTK